MESGSALAAPVTRGNIARHFGGHAAFDTGTMRPLAASMLAIAAIRPLVPFDFVPHCPLRTITGVPCPLCGMTRGVTALVHGDLGSALFFNPGSLLAVTIAALLLLWWRAKRIVVPVWVVTAIVALMWSWQLFKYATGRPL